MGDMRVEDVIDAGVRQIPDWPVTGVTFRDITPLCRNPEQLRHVIDGLCTAAEQLGPFDAVLGIEARGFIFAPAVALSAGAGFVPVRKEGKLPAHTLGASYGLEYGSASIEIHADALKPSDRVLIVDDVLATGGTMQAAAQLVHQTGAHVNGFVTIIELAALQGRSELGRSELAGTESHGASIHALRTYT